LTKVVAERAAEVEIAGTVDAEELVAADPSKQVVERENHVERVDEDQSKKE